MLKIKHISHKRLVVAALAALLILGGIGSYAVYRLQQQGTPVYQDQINYDYDDPSSEAARKESIPAKQNPDTSKDPSNSQTPTQSQTNITITSVGQSDGQVMVRALVDGTTKGTCKVTFTKAGQPTITKEASVTAQASYVICQGFNVPINEFSTGGTWNVSIVVDVDGNISAPAQKTVEVNKS